MGAAGIQKICVVCGENVANRPRTKDQHGRYYCNSCWTAETAASPAEATPASDPSTADRSLLDDPIVLKRIAITFVAVLGTIIVVGVSMSIISSIGPIPFISLIVGVPVLVIWFKRRSSDDAARSDRRSSPVLVEVTAECQFCGGEIPHEAKKCRHCGEWVKIEKVIPQRSPVTNPLKTFFLVILVIVILAFSIFLQVVNYSHDQKIGEKAQSQQEQPQQEQKQSIKDFIPHMQGEYMEGTYVEGADDAFKIDVYGAECESGDTGWMIKLNFHMNKLGEDHIGRFVINRIDGNVLTGSYDGCFIDGFRLNSTLELVGTDKIVIKSQKPVWNTDLNPDFDPKMTTEHVEDYQKKPSFSGGN